MNEDNGYQWLPYDNGRTVGVYGPEGGFVLRDEEFRDPDEPEDADARLTLEQLPVSLAGSGPAFALTATLYSGWLMHPWRVGDEATARAAFDATKPELAALAAMIPDEDDRDIAARVETLNRAAEAFTRAH